MSIKWYDVYRHLYKNKCQEFLFAAFWSTNTHTHTHLCYSFVDSNKHSHFNKSSRKTNQYHRMLLCEYNFKWVRFLWVFLYFWGMEYSPMFFFRPSKETEKQNSKQAHWNDEQSILFAVITWCDIVTQFSMSDGSTTATDHFVQTNVNCSNIACSSNQTTKKNYFLIAFACKQR